MANDEILRSTIASIFEYLKADRQEYLMISNQLSAMRSALDELSGGKFKPIMEKHVQLLEQRLAAAGLGNVTDYDEMIRRLKAGELF